MRRSVAAGDELELAGTVNTVVEGHGIGESTLGGVASGENVSSGLQTPNPDCLRQPGHFESCLPGFLRVVSS